MLSTSISDLRRYELRQTDTTAPSCSPVEIFWEHKNFVFMASIRFQYRPKMQISNANELMDDDFGIIR
jgi:hypothetical protein